MSYPSSTVVNFQPTQPFMGIQPIATTSTTQNHVLGTVVTAVDVGTAQLGEAKFIYAKGVGSTAAGDLCVIDTKAGTTARAVHTTAARGMLGVSMSANVASQYGWYQIYGAGPIASVTGTAANAVYFTSTAGTVDSVDVATDRVDGAWFTVTGSGGFSYVQLAFPFAHGSGGD